MLRHVCLWLHGRPQLPLAARIATLSLQVSPPPCHLQAHQVPLPWQVEGGAPGSRDTAATAHTGTAETALLASVSRAVPSRGGETAVPCSPSAPERVCCGRGGPCLTGMSVEGNLLCLPPCCVRANMPVCSSFRITAPRSGKGLFP